jgi:hypothetical protein
VIVRDRTWDQNELAAITTPGIVSDFAMPRISATGQYVVYQSADNIYRRDRGPTLHRNYCTGDGQAAACPCGNASILGSGQGCLNSLGTGARLEITGTASVANDSLTLLGSNMPDSAALYFQGSSAFAGGLGAPFGDGLRCVGGTLFRFAPKLNMGGSSAYPLVGDPSISVQGNVTTPGSRFYQVRYRNSAAFCTSDTFNMSNGVEVVWVP